ncbi:MAG: hypothetical protein ACE14M_11550 [Terriglobales bacterium]
MSFRRLLLVCVAQIALLVALTPRCQAHGMVGDRMFIEPLFAEDANIKNELVLPRAEFLRMPDGTVRAFSFGLEKEIVHDRLSVSVEQDVLSVRDEGRTATGFDNLEFGAKFAAYTNERHEFILSPAFSVLVPTGSEKVAERHTALHPAILWAKGLGDLPVQWLRPFAVQGDLGLHISASGERERAITYDTVLVYSLPYLNHFVRKADSAYKTEDTLRLGTSLKAILGDLFPCVEFNGETPVSGTFGSTSTFLRPGLLYMGKYIQMGAAADIPLRVESPFRGRGPGAVILIDLFLDRISPVFGWTPFGKHHSD